MNNTIGSATEGKFNWIEYTTFGSLLSVSALIGIYYGCIKGNQNTVSEYMLGGKKMSIFPIAMSLVASHTSGITLLGFPAETYEFGMQFIMSVFGACLLVYVTNVFCLPVFHTLQLKSIFEYLELRFSRTVCKLCSLIFAISLVLYIPVVVYIPALAFHQVSGASVHVVTPIICSLCIFYTTIGGLKAVVWTDTVQGLFTLVVTIIVITLGVINIGGFQKIYEASVRSGRWEFFNLDPNPFARMSLWSAIIGNFSFWVTGLAVHPGSTQRFIALRSKRAAQWSVVWFAVCVNIFVCLSSFAGILMYAHFEGCDPLKEQRAVHKSGQLLPYYVQQVAADFPGLTGLFISGLISAALSTMSAGLNTAAGTLYEDFADPLMPKNRSEWVASFVMKVIVVILGVICVGLVYVVEKLGTVLQVTLSVAGSPNAALFTAFALGLFFPWANSKGAICGALTSLLFTSWVILRSQLAILNHQLVFIGKETSIENCTEKVNYTAPVYSNMREIAHGVLIDEDSNPLYALSFLYYIPVGAALGVFTGLVVSLLTGGNDLKKLNPELITPKLRKLLPPNENKMKNEYKGVLRNIFFIDVLVGINLIICFVIIYRIF